MTENEIILVENISPAQFDKLMRKAVAYAIISIPFTYNRMNLDSLNQKIKNVAKGKIAEEILREFLLANGIEIDSAPCNTPFWAADKRDFIWGDKEWDLKNNYIYHQGYYYASGHYTDLPALIPNKNPNDQWAYRNVSKTGKAKNVAFLFSFLKNLDRYAKDGAFFEIELSFLQQKFLMELYQSYGGGSVKSEPYSESFFWTEFNSRGGPFGISFKQRPALVIGPYAESQHWELFSDTGEGPKHFGDRCLFSVINNRACTWKNLPSFASLFPEWREKMALARFRVAY
jgi:hypothetical protein